MTPPAITVLHGDCLDLLRTLPDSSVDSIVTDPPYGLEFMGKTWDSFREEAPCATPTGTAPSRTATAAPSAASASSGTESTAPSAATNGATSGAGPDPARAASATVVDAAAVGGYQDGNGGNAYSRSRVRTNTQRHGGDSAAANRRFGAWCEQWTIECLRVLKPGGHLLAFGGTRTWHRLAVAVEDAGFEIRDSIAWLYGSGFPKSLDVSKSIDKAAGAEREVIGRAARAGGMHRGLLDAAPDTTGSHIWAGDAGALTAPATDAAAQWSGWGTALKPAFEPIVVGRKPLVGTVARNVQEHGTGALNIDGCRVQAAAGDYAHPGNDLGDRDDKTDWRIQKRQVEPHAQGRWPANVLLSDDQAAELDRQSGISKDGTAIRSNVPSNIGDGAIYGKAAGRLDSDLGYGSEGGASRFFPIFRVAKKPSGSRVDNTGASVTNNVCERFMAAHEDDVTGWCPVCETRVVERAVGCAPDFPTFRYEAKAPTRERPRDGDTAHPTVKPLDLMRWLVRLVTPPGGTVLEPFAGSGTTVEACLLEGFGCIAIEREADYLPLIEQRVARARAVLAEREAAARAVEQEREWDLFSTTEGET